MVKDTKKKQKVKKESVKDQKMADLGEKVTGGQEKTDKKLPPRAQKAKPKPERKALNYMNRNELRKEVSRLRRLEDQYEQEKESLRAAGIPTDAGVPEIPPEVYGSFASMIFDYLASRFGEHWKLSLQEVKAYGQAIEACGRRYLPEASATHPELVALGVVAVTTISPRAFVTVAMKQKKKEVESEQETIAEPAAAGHA